MNKAGIIENLKKSGIRAGDLVIVHSSFKSLGPVEGGPHAFIEALLEAVGTRGTILMPAFTFSLRDAERPVFDVAETPSCVGAVTEVFRREYASRRSIHLSHSYAALGALAEELCSHELDITPCGESSPLGKFLHHDGKILLVGVGYNSCTAFHVVEEMMHAPYMNFRINENAQYKLAGKLYPLPSRILSRGFKYDFTIVTEQFIAQDVVREEKIGDATLKILSGEKFVAAVRERLETDINCFFKAFK